MTISMGVASKANFYRKFLSSAKSQVPMEKQTTSVLEVTAPAPIADFYRLALSKRLKRQEGLEEAQFALEGVEETDEREYAEAGVFDSYSALDADGGFQAGGPSSFESTGVSYAQAGKVVSDAGGGRREFRLESLGLRGPVAFSWWGCGCRRRRWGVCDC